MPEKQYLPMYCPRCGKGKIYVTNKANVRVSVMCPNQRCSKQFVADLYTMETYISDENPERNWPRVRKLPCPCPGCQGFTITDGEAETMISIKCAKDHKRFGVRKYSRYYQADLMTGNTMLIPPKRNVREEKGGYDKKIKYYHRQLCVD